MRVIPDLQLHAVDALPAAAAHARQFLVQAGKLWFSDGTTWVQIGGVVKLYPKTYVDTASGTFTLPATALPDVDVLLVGGGTSGASAPTQRGEGGDSTLKNSAAEVLLTAEGGKQLRPGRGGGTAARHVGATSSNPGATGVRGRFGFGCGGGAGPWESAGTGVVGLAAQAGTGDGGGGYSAATSASVGGNGGGVVYQKCVLTPGETYTHTIGAGGIRTSGAIGEPGGSGRVEYRYMDTVP